MAKIIKKSYIATVGRRKTAISRVRLFTQGDGKILVNDKDIKTYFSTTELSNRAVKPLKLTNLAIQVSATIKTSGGGKSAQADSVSLALARALVIFNEELKIDLKKQGLLKRDSRKKERKKPGLRRARRAPQWSKR
ncbi:MAG: 30S ribosomal protein S9 [Patescibacteria group bacterium]